MGKKKLPSVVHLEISPTSQSERLEGLDILARLIARNILTGRLPPPRRLKSKNVDDT